MNPFLAISKWCDTALGIESIWLVLMLYILPALAVLSVLLVLPSWKTRWGQWVALAIPPVFGASLALRETLRMGTNYYRLAKVIGWSSIVLNGDKVMNKLQAVCGPLPDASSAGEFLFALTREQWDCLASIEGNTGIYMAGMRNGFLGCLSWAGMDARLSPSEQLGAAWWLLAIPMAVILWDVAGHRWWLAFLETVMTAVLAILPATGMLFMGAGMITIRLISLIRYRSPDMHPRTDNQNPNTLKKRKE